MTKNDLNAGIMALLDVLHPDKAVPSGVAYMAFQTADSRLWTLDNYQLLLRVCASAGLVADTDHRLSLTATGRAKAEEIKALSAALSRS